MGWTHLRACYGFNMRVWIGGVLTTYPARWFFCDPNAKMFPNPHGAEAEPWLKDFEINKEWGDDGTLKKLDRGINPGYPGQCFVGAPSWFIDGQLPADFLAGPQKHTPPCCGHTPPLNPDPRCPPWRSLGPCIFCEEGEAWDTYTVTGKNGTGDFAQFNGSYQIARLGACLWVLTFGPGHPIITLNINGFPTHAFLTVQQFNLPGTPIVVVHKESPYYCLQKNEGWIIQSTIGTGVPPDFTVE